MTEEANAVVADVQEDVDNIFMFNNFPELDPKFDFVPGLVLGV